MRPIKMHDYGKMLRILCRLRFFEKFSHVEQLELIKAKNMFVVAAPDEQIVERGFRGNSFYVIVSGEAGVMAPTGDPEPAARLGPGDVFGEVAFLSGAERTADVKAIEQTILFWMDRRSMGKLQMPLREKIKDQLIDCLVARIHDLNNRLYQIEEHAPGAAAGTEPEEDQTNDNASDEELVDHPEEGEPTAH